MRIPLFIYHGWKLVLLLQTEKIFDCGKFSAMNFLNIASPLFSFFNKFLLDLIYLPDLFLFYFFSICDIFQVTCFCFSSLLVNPFSELLYFNGMFFTVMSFYFVFFQMYLFLPFDSIAHV